MPLVVLSVRLTPTFGVLIALTSEHYNSTFIRSLELSFGTGASPSDSSVVLNFNWISDLVLLQLYFKIHSVGFNMIFDH